MPSSAGHGQSIERFLPVPWRCHARAGLPRASDDKIIPGGELGSGNDQAEGGGGSRAGISTMEHAPLTVLPWRESSGLTELIRRVRTFPAHTGLFPPSRAAAPDTKASSKTGTAKRTDSARGLHTAGRWMRYAACRGSEMATSLPKASDAQLRSRARLP